MRFTVHDSPDYYQLKVSVFNDDKKTDLIGETWIDLKDVLVPGGGQSDVWHNLNYRGKYAGEVRMEITYYDSRPKQEKPKTREGTPANADVASRESASGPRVQKERVKRRPLPSDPISGIAPPLTETQPQRVGPRDPRPKVAPAPASAPVEPPERPTQQPRGYPSGLPEYQQPGGYPAAPESVQRESQQGYSTPEQMRGYGQPAQPQSGYLQDQSPLQRVEYQNQDYGRPTSRGDQGRYEQSPPQAEYGNKPSLNIARSNQSLNNQEPSYGQVPGLQESQVARDLYNQRYNQTQHVYAESVISSQASDDPYTRGRTDQRNEYAPQQATYNPPPPSQYDQPSSPDGPPPPPPVHRHPVSANSSAPTTPGYGYTAPNPVKDQFERLRDGHRKSMPAYSNTPAPYQNTYTPPGQPYAPQPQQPQLQHAYTEPVIHHTEQPRHKLLEEYDNHYSSMQPTVEDAPPTPSPFLQEARPNVVQPSHHYTNERQYDDIPSPAPLSFNRPGSSSSMMPRPVPVATVGSYNNAGYASDPYTNQSHSAPPPTEYVQPAYTRDNRSTSPAPPPSEYSQPAYARDNRSRSPAPPRNDYAQPSYDRSRSPAPPQAHQELHRSVSPAPPQRYQEEELERPGSGYMPPLPPTLVAGLDPAIAQEISDRIYSESRFQRQPRQPRQEPQETNWARDAAQRHVESNQYGRPTSSQGPRRPFVPASSYATQERQGRGVPSTYTPVAMKPRATSPMPPQQSPSHQHTISRKSVSPAPPPSRGSDEGRQGRLSVVPFGPDDYSALNPNVPVVAATIAAQDPDAKIVLHDGREVDPSDHLPSSSWAALPPNLKKSFDNASARETRLRGVTQPQTRRMERRDRPQSEAYSRAETMTPPAAGRNRLVKKTNRMSAQPQSSPLVPISPNPDRYARSRDDYRSEPDAGRYVAPSRAQTFDTGYMDREREVYGSGYRGGGPPAPPKIPLPHSSSGPPGMGVPPGIGPGGGRDPNESAWALLEEMKSIDLGSGTRRRRGGHAVV